MPGDASQEILKPFQVFQTQAMVHAAVKKNIVGSTQIVLQNIGNSEVHTQSLLSGLFARGLNWRIHIINGSHLETASCQFDGIRSRPAANLENSFAGQLSRIQYPD